MKITKKENERFTTKDGFLNFTTEDDCIVLDLIKVNSDKRKKGIGTALMQAFCSYVDEQDKKAELYAYEQDDTSLEELIAFYNKFGFYEDSREEDGVFMSR